MRLTDVKVLSFDCYGTLIDWETGILQALAPLCGDLVAQQPAMLLEAFADIEPRVEAANPGLLYRDILSRVHARLADRLGLAGGGSMDAAFGASVGDWPAFADSPVALRGLKKHCRLIILSNVDRKSFAASNQHLGVAFDKVLTAEDIGAYKPDERNFRALMAAVAAMEIDRRAHLHVAQSLYHDHLPAKALGIATCWINRRHGKKGAGATRMPPQAVGPDFEFADMASLAAAFEAAPER